MARRVRRNDKLAFALAPPLSFTTRHNLRQGRINVTNVASTNLNIRQNTPTSYHKCRLLIRHVSTNAPAQLRREPYPKRPLSPSLSVLLRSPHNHNQPTPITQHGVREFDPMSTLDTFTAASEKVNSQPQTSVGISTSSTTTTGIGHVSTSTNAPHGATLRPNDKTSSFCSLLLSSSSPQAQSTTANYTTWRAWLLDPSQPQTNIRIRTVQQQTNPIGNLPQLPSNASAPTLSLAQQSHSQSLSLSRVWARRQGRREART